MFRFTIRDVLWLTVLVALGVGWWVQSRHAEHAFAERLNAQQQSFRQQYASIKQQANAQGFKLLNSHGAPILVRADLAPDISE